LQEVQNLARYCNLLLLALLWIFFTLHKAAIHMTTHLIPSCC
jgi:hypothetical protein